jgi:FkbM family methyltransferase
MPNGPEPPPAPTAQTKDGEVEARIRFYEATRAHTPYIGVATDSGSYVVATTDQHIGKSLYAKRGRPEFRVLGVSVAAARILLGEDCISNRVFIDVGANIGTTTIPALVTHGFESAVCIEPEEENFRVLRANLALNGLVERSSAVRAGVSNRTGRSDLVVVEGAGGKPWIAVDAETAEQARESHERLAAEEADRERPPMSVVEVELVTLDHLASEGTIDLDRLGMLWVDAEGHEGHVIEGATELVARGIPMVFEFHPEGLDERGDRDKIHELAEEHYTHFVDVRRQETDPAQPRFMLRPVSDLGRFAERFLDPESPGYFTDLLMVRLDPKQAARGKRLPELMRRR